MNSVVDNVLSIEATFIAQVPKKEKQIMSTEKASKINEKLPFKLVIDITNNLLKAVSIVNGISKPYIESKSSNQRKTG